MDRYNQKHNLYKFVDALRNIFKLSLSEYPVNSLAICKNDVTTDIIYHDFHSYGFCAAAIKGAKQDTVILNSKRTKVELNFDCAHEIIHLTKHRDADTPMFNCIAQHQDTYMEWEANEGAAELLVPMQLLLPEIKKRSIKTWNDINSMKFDLSNLFNVSDAVIQFRLESLKYEIHQYLNGTSINDIEILSISAQKKRDIQIKSLNTLEEELFKAEMNKWRQSKKKPCIDVF